MSINFDNIWNKIHIKLMLWIVVQIIFIFFLRIQNINSVWMWWVCGNVSVDEYQKCRRFFMNAKNVKKIWKILSTFYVQIDFFLVTL